MTVRQRYAKLADHLVGAAEIAEASEVGVSAVCNWIARWDDFPSPLTRFGNADVYARDEIEDCLRRHGRGFNFTRGTKA